MSLGFLRAAFRPDGEVCVVRAVARQRDVLLADQASWVQRMQKALVQMNIQIRVSSDSKNSNASAALPRSTAVPLRLASRSTQTRFQRKTGDQPVLFLMSTPRPTTSVVRPPRGKENLGTALRFLESRLIKGVEPFHGCPQHTEAGHCFRAGHGVERCAAVLRYRKLPHEVRKGAGTFNPFADSIKQLTMPVSKGL